MQGRKSSNASDFGCCKEACLAATEAPETAAPGLRSQPGRSRSVRRLLQRCVAERGDARSLHLDLERALRLRSHGADARGLRRDDRTVLVEEIDGDGVARRGGAAVLDRPAQRVVRTV